MMKQAYVLYANDNYFDIVSMCAKSIRTFSSHPIIVYMLNSDRKVDVSDTISIRWNCNIDEFSSEDMYHQHSVGQNFYVNRSSDKIYNLLIQRPLVVRDALLKHADVVVYVDCDSVATPYVDRLFDMYDVESVHPYITEGIYNYLHIDGRGGTTEKETLEYNACELFGANQKNRFVYRTTNVFVAGKKTIEFLEEWYWMCTHPKILKNFKVYAPFHEETIVNVLLWKYDYIKGLPYVYVNADYEKADKVFNHLTFTYKEVLLDDWFKVPGKKEDIAFFHGEKRVEEMQKMLDMMRTKLNILFLAPHLSTGGMPAFLLKRIESLKDSVNIYVVEHSDVSPHYIVQKEKIKKIVKNFWTLEDDKKYLLTILKANNIDIVHIDDVSEAIDQDLARVLFDENRKWRIVETCHNISFNPNKDKLWTPDAFAFCTPYHEKTFANIHCHKQTIEFPIDPLPVSQIDKYESRIKLKLDLFKKHVINVGLWTPGKNQAEGIEIAKKYPEIQFHFIGNQAPNFEEYWKPLMVNLPKNVIVWEERDDVELFMKAADIFMFNSTWECNPLVIREAISYGLPIIARNLPQYQNMFNEYIQPLTTDLNNIKPNYIIPKNNKSKEFSNNHVNLYKTIKNMKAEKQEDFKYKMFLIDGLYFELIKTPEEKAYTIKIFDGNEILYSSKMTKNMWSRTNRKYLSNYIVEIWDDTILLKTIKYLDGIKGSRVFISFESSCLGDSISWIPYCLEFKKQYGCDVIVSTFKNFLFENAYPELEFVERGVQVDNIYAFLKIGWFYNKDSEPIHPVTIPLQKAICNIINIPYTEIKPTIAFTPKERPIEEKYITIATQSTAQCKHWYHWTELIDYLTSKGYKVVEVSKETVICNNLINPEDISLETTMNYIHHSEFFIGLSSGLSWLSWALGKHVVMISNFTEEGHEFTSNCTRITNKNVCHGCWNNPNFLFDKGDWNWCPVHKETSKAFECHTSILSTDVIKQLDWLLPR